MWWPLKIVQNVSNMDYGWLKMLPLPLQEKFVSLCIILLCSVPPFLSKNHILTFSQQKPPTKVTISTNHHFLSPDNCPHSLNIHPVWKFVLKLWQRFWQALCAIRWRSFSVQIMWVDLGAFQAITRQICTEIDNCCIHSFTFQLLCLGCYVLVTVFQSLCFSGFSNHPELHEAIFVDTAYRWLVLVPLFQSLFATFNSVMSQ